MTTFDDSTKSHALRPRRRVRMLVVAGCAIACLVAGWLGYRWFFRLPVGSGPAGPAVPAEPFLNVWTTRPVQLVGIGDSVTAGFGALPGHSYFEMLVTNPADETGGMYGINLRRVLPSLRVLNLAVSGTTSLQHETDQISQLEACSPEVFGFVVMTTGGNDLIHDYGRSPPREGAMYGATLQQAQPWINAFDARLDRILARIEANFPGGCRIFLANIYDPTDGVGDIDRAGLPLWPDGLRILAAYNRILEEHARRRPEVRLVNLHDAFLGHGLHCTQPWQNHYRRADPHYWYFTNLEDPNDRGYDAIRRLFLLEIIEASRVFAPGHSSGRSLGRR